MKKCAVLYDFDKTLCDKDMQEYSLIPSLGYDSAKDFWDEVTELAIRNRMDGISAYLYLLEKKFAELNGALYKTDFQGLGRNIHLYPGVEGWFERINTYGRKAGFLVEHYIISSGMEEILKDTAIADEFKEIYACRYYYENGKAVWPAQIVNYTTKTQYMFRVNKGALDVNENARLNEYVDPQKRDIPFSRMIYIGDGMTDVPCMRLVKEYGGRSIAVYGKGDELARKLKEQGRVNFVAPADYSEGTVLDTYLKRCIDHMKADAALEDLAE